MLRNENFILKMLSLFKVRQVANIMYVLSRAARLGLPSFLSAIRWNSRSA
jgi:hypothetical protein